MLLAFVLIWVLIFLGTIVHGMNHLRPATVPQAPELEQSPSPAPKSPLVMQIPIVEDSVEENGKIVTNVVYTIPGRTQMNTVITYLLIGAASTYLVVMVV